MIIGWNARSIRERVRNEFMWHIITEQNPDIMIIVETWMNEEIKVLNTKYKVIQTKKQNFQGVSIISKDFDIKIEWEDVQTSWFLVSSIRKEGKVIAYVIGIYRKTTLKREITQEISNILKRIRRKHQKISIIIYGDMNTNRKDNIEKLKNLWKLRCNPNNKMLITRTQMIKDKQTESTLDFIMSTDNIKNIRRIEQKGGSDHYPILAEIEISNNWRTNKTYKLTRINRNPTREQITELFKTGWPLQECKNKLHWFNNTSTIRPKIYISLEKQKAFKEDTWENIINKIKEITKQEYDEFINEINVQNQNDIVRFYKSINNIIKYKNKNKIVKSIKKNNEIQTKSKSLKIWLQYYDQILNTNEPITKRWYTNNEKYEVKTLRGLMTLARNKATGIDKVPGEWIRVTNENNDIDKMKTTFINNIFVDWVKNKNIPNFWMRSKLILISKEENNSPEVHNTRPIAILPSITKAFEISIISNIEEIAYKQGYISENQRGFTPRKSTSINIEDLITFWIQAKLRRKLKTTSALIFIDLKRAYDSINRNKLLNILNEANIPGNIIEIIKIMY